MYALAAYVSGDCSSLINRHPGDGSATPCHANAGSIFSRASRFVLSQYLAAQGAKPASSSVTPGREWEARRATALRLSSFFDFC